MTRGDTPSSKITDKMRGRDTQKVSARGHRQRVRTVKNKGRIKMGKKMIDHEKNRGKNHKGTTVARLRVGGQKQH